MVDCFVAENIYVLEGQFIILEPFKRDVYMYIAQWARIKTIIAKRVMKRPINVQKSDRL